MSREAGFLLGNCLCKGPEVTGEGKAELERVRAMSEGRWRQSLPLGEMTDLGELVWKSSLL